MDFFVKISIDCSFMMPALISCFPHFCHVRHVSKEVKFDHLYCRFSPAHSPTFRGHTLSRLSQIANYSIQACFSAVVNVVAPARGVKK